MRAVCARQERWRRRLRWLLRSRLGEQFVAAVRRAEKALQKMKTQKGEIVGAVVMYQFRCDGCDSEGQLTVPLEYGIRIECPAGCGAAFTQWKGVDGGPALTCVVAPIPYRPDEYYLEDDEEEDEDYDDADLDGLDDLDEEDDVDADQAEEPAPPDPRQQELDL